MLKENPYKTPQVSEGMHIESQLDATRCPSCSHPVSRWSVWNTIASKRCSNCGDKLWLELSVLMRVVLVLIGMGIYGLWWLFFETPFVTPVFMIAVMPFLMLGISCWMQVAFGTLKSTNESPR